METVFITIHDLSLDARILYASDSVEDILGYSPTQIKGKSCWDYFHPDEIPFAKDVHKRGIKLDRAAVLNYCQVKHRDGSWIGCECVFTVVYDVLVASTSIYRRNTRARQRAIDGAGVRRIFSSSPRDPRYHMLSFISSKFITAPSLDAHEPRAALFLNRFTRTSTIMYATKGVANILGISAEQLVGKSFYYCIAQNCLKDAVRCLESAKGNDSIAYLRFWYRDPLQAGSEADSLHLIDGHSSDEDDEDGGVRVNAENRNVAMTATTQPGAQEYPPSIVEPTPATETIQDHTQLSPHESHVNGVHSEDEHRTSRTSSGNSTDLASDAPDAIFDRPATLHHSSSTTTAATELQDTSFELEAVVSCSSDGLILIIRRARPIVPQAFDQSEVPHYVNGLFASPWATEPVMPPHAPSTIPPEAAGTPSSEPEPASFMTAIREIAVFAWTLTGINGAIAEYGRGKPTGESLPPGGFPIWDPEAPHDPEADKFNGFAPNTHRPLDGVDDPYEIRKQSDESSSEDEILWRRGTSMPPWRRPARRDHQDAFGADGDSAEDEGEGRRTRRRRIVEEG